MTEVLIPIAHGSEEIEAVTLIDLLVRAGVQVTVASCNADGSKTCVMSRGVKLVADSTIDEVSNRVFDLIALPGGMPGAQHLADSQTLVQILAQQRQQGRWLAAICAAPAVVLQSHGLLGQQATCHPAFLSQLPDEVRNAKLPVVVDHQARIVTSQGPGTAILFALQLIKLLCGPQVYQQVADPLVLYHHTNDGV
jgi:4-methyl-5(b-hydroxyethyl)-thiazole monophosphate biosynthesis